MISGILVKLIISILLGAAIGLERESSKQGPGSLGGIRTYSLISLLGSICGLIYQGGFEILAVIIASTFFLVLISYYIVGSIHSKDLGLTSEISVILTFIIGLLVSLEIIPLQIIVFISVILLLILSLKSKTRKIISGISQQEVQSFISYAIIALVILPFLPNQGYKLTDIPVLSTILQGANINLGDFANLELINLQKVWIVVVLITGIDVFGYVLGRIIGNKKSFALASFIGGFVSSTSTTQSLAQKSKKSSVVNYLVSAAVLANMASFLQIFLLVGPLNIKWLIFILPSLIIIIFSAATISLFFSQKNEDSKEEVQQDTKKGKIFSLLPALKFAGLLIIIKLATKICLILFGQSGFLISSIIASFAGLDAILVNLAEMAGNTISFKFALLTFLMVSGTNLITKSFYSFIQGNRKFAWKFLVSALIIISTSFLGLIFSK